MFSKRHQTILIIQMIQMIQINVNNKYMTFWDKKDYKLVGFEKSERKNKMYNAVLKSKFGLYHRVPFGDKRFENFRDKTGLNLYPHLIHNDEERRKNCRKRHQIYLKEGYYSPGFFSFNYLW